MPASPTPASASPVPRNDQFLRALRREPTTHTPIWLMRQAGRYLPEYRATRARAGDFMSLCRSPELACEVTLQPLARFPLDAAILFSDILTIPDAMGLGLSFAEGEGPRFARPIRDEADVARLGVPDPADELRYVMDAVRTIRGALADRVPLIGFAGSPWTLATYMVEGAGGSDFRRIKTLVYRRPDLLHRLLEINARAVELYLQAQVEAGAQALMIFDTWGGLLSGGAYRQCSLAYMERIVAGLRARSDVPVILFTKGGGVWLEDMAATGCAGLGVDWTVDLGRARSRVGARCALQGNLDPVILQAGPEVVRAQARAVLDDFGPPSMGESHIFNLGHGITPDTPIDSVGALVDEVHCYSSLQRQTAATTDER